MMADLDNPQYRAPLVERFVSDTFERRDSDREAAVELMGVRGVG